MITFRPYCILLILLVGLSSCTGAGNSVTFVPENGYAKTLNYQFQATIRATGEGECQQIIVRVRPLNKMYSGDQPPDRLQLIDDDCNLPVRFERVNYIERRTSNPVRLTGFEVNRFWIANSKMETEMTEWLWRSGIGG